MSDHRHTILRYAPTLGGRGAAALGGVLLPLYVARSIGVEEFGLFSIAHTLLLILAIPAAAGTPITMMRYVGPHWHEQRYDQLSGIYRSAAKLVLIASVPLAILLATASPILAKHAFAEPVLTDTLIMVSIILPMAGLCSMHAGFFKGMDKPAIGSLLEWGGIALLALILLGACMFWTGTGSLSSVMWTLLVAYLGALAGSHLLLRRRIRPATVQQAMELRTLLQPGMDAALTQLAVFFNAWAAILILGALGNAQEVGLYSAAFRLAFLISFLLIVVNAVVPPRMAALFERDDRAGLEQLAVRTALLVTALALPVAGLFMAFPQFFLGLFGEDFGDAAKLLRIVTIGQFVNAITGSVGYLLMMSDLGHIIRRISIWSAVITAALLITIVPGFGSTGAAWVTATMMAAQNLLAAWFVWKKLGIRTIPGWRWLSERRAGP